VIGLLQRYPRAVLGSLLFHALIIGLVLANYHFSDESEKVQVQAPLVKTVKAEVVSEKEITRQAELKQQEADRKKNVANEAAKKRKTEKKKADAAKKKLADKKRKSEAAKKRKAEAAKKSKADAKKKADLAKKKEADKKRKLKAEKQKKAEVEKKRLADAAAQKKQQEDELKLAIEKEQKERDELERKQKEAERTAAEEKKRREAESRLAAEKERLAKEAAIKARVQDEENKRRLNSLRDAYILAIREKIERKWRQPPGSDKIDCELHVVQGPGGIILDVRFGNCPGGSPAYRASIENAVYKAEPLPKPGDDSLFERDLKFLFNAE
jgi:colicin import membrane protein